MLRTMTTAFHYWNSSGCEARDFLLPTTSPNWRHWVEFNKTVTRNEGVHPSVYQVWLRSNVTPCFKEFQMVANFTAAGLGCVMLHVVTPMRQLSKNAMHFSPILGGGEFLHFFTSKYFVVVRGPSRKCLNSTSITLRPPSFSKYFLIYHSRIIYSQLCLP